MRNILVIDDDTDLNQTLTEFLSDVGYTVNSVTDPDTVDDAIARGDFDTILLDLKMPNRSGTDFIRTIKETRPETNLIVMSGKAFVKELLEEMSLEQYVNAILEKPFSVDLLLDKLDHVDESGHTL